MSILFALVGDVEIKRLQREKNALSFPGTTLDTMEVAGRFGFFQLGLCRYCNEDTIYLLLYDCFFNKYFKFFPFICRTANLKNMNRGEPNAQV